VLINRWARVSLGAAAAIASTSKPSPRHLLDGVTVRLSHRRISVLKAP